MDVRANSRGPDLGCIDAHRPCYRILEKLSRVCTAQKARVEQIAPSVLWKVAQVNAVDADLGEEDIWRDIVARFL